MECFLPQCYKRTDTNQFINTRMFYCNLGTESSYFVPELLAVIGSDTTLYKFNVEIVHVFKSFCKGLSSHTLIKTVGWNFTLT